MATSRNGDHHRCVYYSACVPAISGRHCHGTLRRISVALAAHRRRRGSDRCAARAAKSPRNSGRKADVTFRCLASDVFEAYSKRSNALLGGPGGSAGLLTTASSADLAASGGHRRVALHVPIVLAVVFAGRAAPSSGSPCWLCWFSKSSPSPRAVPRLVDDGRRTWGSLPGLASSLMSPFVEPSGWLRRFMTLPVYISTSSS